MATTVWCKCSVAVSTVAEYSLVVVPQPGNLSVRPLGEAGSGVKVSAPREIGRHKNAPLNCS